MTGFQGKVAIVTGAASGIGEAIARELAAGGATVIVADLEGSAAERVAAEITSGGGAACGLGMDVADPASVERMVSFAVSTFGGLHLAVNNAGIGGPSETTAIIRWTAGAKSWT